MTVVVAIAAVVLLLAHPAALGASDVFSNVGPASQVPGGSLIDAYPLGNYGLDGHFKAVEAGVFEGVDTSGIAPTIAWFLAGVVWELTAFIATAAITFGRPTDSVEGAGPGGVVSGWSRLPTSLSATWSRWFEASAESCVTTEHCGS